MTQKKYFMPAHHRRSPSHRYAFKKSVGTSRQRGAVLIVALIFLLLLTMLALSASGRSLLQERMAGGLRSAQQAEASAETALRGAEWSIWKATSRVGGHLNCPNDGISTDDGCIVYNPSDSAYSFNQGAATKFLTSQAWLPNVGKTYLGPTGSGYTSYSDNMSTAALANNPVYMIEDMGRELAPGTGNQHEAGATGPNNIGAGQLNIHVYRITARATGGNANTLRVLQSTFDAQASN